MPIYKINKNKAKQISLDEEGFGNEFKLRDFFAENLEEMLGIRFLDIEYQTTNGRIDTLGIDENNTPVIIEYKWKEKDDVLSQGLFYLDWLVKNKRHFELLVDNKLGKEIKVKWEQPRVILIAQGFNRYTQSAVQQVKNIELKTYSIYGSDILHIENIYTPSNVAQTTQRRRARVDESVVYDLPHHLSITSKEMQKQANELRDMILELPNIEEKLGQKSGITYKTTKSFTRLEFRKTWIHLLVRDPKYKEDNNEIVKDITSNEWAYKGIIKFTPKSNLDYIFSIIKASYNSTL